ncbi:MAG: Pycsar system effector family protein [Bacteroidota bacterium]
MEVENALLLEVEAHVTNFITEQVPKAYSYHNVQHTENVVEAVIEIGQILELTEQEMEILQLAAWFHDTGYDKGPANHEERSAKYLRAFLEPRDYSEAVLQQIEACILATKVPQNPQNNLEAIICDADLNHLGKYNYWDRCGRLRQELAQTKHLNMSDLEWLNFELDFMNGHEYKTAIAQALYNKQKTKHIRQLIKQKKRLIPNEVLTVDEVAQFDKLNKGKKKQKKKKKKSKANDGEAVDLKEINLGRGVETMYRTTYRTHVNLSSIADNKANIMLSINAIIVSITLSTLVPGFSSNPKLILPTGVLLFVCLLAIVFATLSTRPKITEGKFTREDIQNKRSNLLFFGNFYNMSLDDFHWGMMEMIKDEDFLYSSMTRDLYFLGIVLAKKYRYLRICYGVFMYGLIIAVLAFAIAFTI